MIRKDYPAARLSKPRVIPEDPGQPAVLSEGGVLPFPDFYPERNGLLTCPSGKF